MDTGRPPFRYDARLASEIELRWQDRWEREGTFHAANPTGDLSAGFARSPTSSSGELAHVTIQPLSACPRRG